MAMFQSQTDLWGVPSSQENTDSPVNVDEVLTGSCLGCTTGLDFGFTSQGGKKAETG